MFTGIIETVGRIKRIENRQDYIMLIIASSIDIKTIKTGESIACDGACLTVLDCAADSFSVEASHETQQKTILGNYRRGHSVNLERALRLDDRLGGHFVTGHVDTVGIVESVMQVGRSTELSVSFDPTYDQLVVDKGSIAINGISLTVNAANQGRLSVNLIPHTTGLIDDWWLKKGSQVNLEFDLIGKYILKSRQAQLSSVLTRDKIINSGW